MRGRFLNTALLAAVAVGTVWLGSLIYHNRLGGHVAGPPVAWQGSITTEGDVTSVVNEAGFRWGGAGRLEEVLSIGVGAGEAEYMLGDRISIAATDNRIYVADPSVPAVRAYDAEGRHLMDVGRPGQGPGEFNGLRSVAVGSDGRIYVFADSRVNVFSAEGESIATWPHATGLDSVTPPVIADDGKLYLDDLIGDTLDVMSWRHGMVAAGPQGPQGRPIPVPPFEWRREGNIRRFPGGGFMNERPPFTPRLLWVMTPTRAIVAGVPSAYRFEIHALDGSITRVETSWEPVPVTEEEATWQRSWIIHTRQSEDPGWRWTAPDIPAHKPAYEGFHAGSAGRIWVGRLIDTVRIDDCDPDPTRPAGRDARSCWRHRYGYDVYDPQGRLLGPVEAPGGRLLSSPVMRADDVIGYVEDEDGVGRVKRYRLVLTGAS